MLRFVNGFISTRIYGYGYGSVNYLYRDRVKVRERVSGRVTDRVRVRVSRPDSSGNLLIRRKIHYAPNTVLSLASSECGEFVELVEDLFYTQHVLCPTRGDAVLDLMLTSEPDLVSDVHIIKSLGSSDHNMVVFTAGTHLSCTPYSSNKQVWDCKLGSYPVCSPILAC